MLIFSEQINETPDLRIRKIYLTQRNISDVLGICLRTTHKAIAKLKELSVLKVEKRNWNVGQSSLYTLSLPKHNNH